MARKMRGWIVVFLGLGFAQGSWSQAVEVSGGDTKKESPKVGAEAARKYFQGRKTQPGSSRAPAASGLRYLAIRFGTYINEETYKWGRNNKNNVGKIDAGVTYKIGEWKGSMDLMLNADLLTYDLIEGRPVKISLMPAIVFPDANSEFPLYFGAGAGVGVFFKQIEDESSFSFDYSLFTGVRFFDLWQGLGLLFEAGLRDQLFLLSDGQHNGVYLNVGAVFHF